MAPYSTAGTREERRFAAVFLMLRHPGLKPYAARGVARKTPLGRIDELRDNWWCSFGAKPEPDTFNYYNIGAPFPEPLKCVYPGGKVDPPSFLTASERQAAEREWKKLAALPTAPSYLSRAVIDWALRYPSDPRIPYALHLAVKSTRYGCTDATTSEVSKKAFEILHRKYPGSDWAKQTKYYF